MIVYDGTGSSSHKVVKYIYSSTVLKVAVSLSAHFVDLKPIDLFRNGVIKINIAILFGKPISLYVV